MGGETGDLEAQQLLYASLAWSGFVKSEERTKLQLILNKESRYGFLPA